jgi:protein phosphatase
MEKFTIAHQSFTGHRENNEDACLVLKLGDKGLFLAVADGMGGYEGGEIASNLILFKIKQFLEKNYHDSLKPENLKSILTDCFELAQCTIRQKVLEEPSLQGMGTTLTALIIYDNCYAYGNIGDSRIYLIAPVFTRQITVDHTYIEEFRQKFQESITPEFLARYGHILTRTIDGKQDIPDIFPLEEGYLSLNPGEMLLLCSDGLILSKSDQSNGFITTQIQSAPTIAEAVKKLVLYAYENGASDNITVVLVRYNSQIIKREVETPLKTATSNDPKTIQIPAYVRKSKTPHFSGKTINTIGFVALTIFTLLIVVSIFDMNPFKSKEPASRQKITFVAKTPVGVVANKILSSANKSFPAGTVNKDREKYLLLISKILTYKFNPKVLKNMVHDISDIKPPYVSDLKTDSWQNMLKDQIVNKGIKKQRLIIEPGKIIRQVDATHFLIILFKAENEEVKDSLDYIAKNGMQFFTLTLATIISKYLDFKKAARIVEGQILYMVKYDNEGNIVENPFHFDATKGSFPNPTLKQTCKNRQLAPLIVTYRNHKTIDLIYPLNEYKGCLRIGFPLQVSN